MDKQQIIDYVMNSPANTNPNVLGTMLDGIGGDKNIHSVEVANLNAYRASSNEAYEVTSDKTFAELMEAYENGAVIVLQVKEQTGSNPYHIYSGIAGVNSTFNEHSELVIDRFTATKTIDGYTGDRIEMSIADYGVYYSYFRGTN